MKFEELESYKGITEYLSKKKRKTHLLLGNGFSIAFDEAIFSYNAPSNYIDESGNKLISELFKAVKTTNFEAIMQQLNILASLVSVFKIPQTYKLNIQETKDELQKNLIKAIQQLHPEHVHKIPEVKSKSCFDFFKYFLSNGSNIFSTNYDLLLYWILMRNKAENADDGFRRESDDSSDLIWDPYKDNQTIHYLHGALPLFDNGIDIIKEEYSMGSNLINKIQDRMSHGKYPIFVTGGKEKEKLQQITHNKYLNYCYDKLCHIKGSLITFGFSFNENDYHIIRAINKAHKNNLLLSVYIGVYDEENLLYLESISDKIKCKVHYWNAKTANVWV